MAILIKKVSIGLLMMLLSYGCAVQPVDGRFPSLDATAEVDGAIDVGTQDGGPRLPLTNATGQWALLTEDRICIYGGVGDPVENLIWSIYLVNIDDVGTGTALLGQEIRLCGQQLSPLPFGFLSIVPQALTRALPSSRFAGFVAGREPGSAYVTEPFMDLWGAEGIGFDDEMPASADDSRVKDQDGDDEPGVTLPVTTPDGMPICQVRVVQRTRIQLEGEVVGENSIEGVLYSQSDKVVLSASSDLCASGDTGDSLGVSRFRLVRLTDREGSLELDANADGSITCEEVGTVGMLRRFTTFSRSEPDAANCAPAAE